MNRHGLTLSRRTMMLGGLGIAAAAGVSTVFREAEAAPSFLKGATLRGFELIGLGASLADSGIPKLSSHQIEFERALLTAFIVRTDYTLLDNPASESTTYLGSMTACFNPYAEFI